MTRILAIDPACRTGFAAGDLGGEPRLGFVDFKREGDKDAEVFARAARWIAQQLHDDPPDIIISEEPVARFDKSLQMGLRGILIGLPACRRIKVIEAPIQTWRKYAYGVGVLSTKEAKRQAVLLCQRLGWPVPNKSRRANSDPDDNAAEAAGLFLYGCALIDPRGAIRHEPLFARG